MFPRAPLSPVLSMVLALPAALQAQTVTPIKPEIAWSYDTQG